MFLGINAGIVEIYSLMGQLLQSFSLPKGLEPFRKVFKIVEDKFCVLMRKDGALYSLDATTYTEHFSSIDWSSPSDMVFNDSVLYVNKKEYDFVASIHVCREHI